MRTLVIASLLFLNALSGYTQGVQHLKVPTDRWHSVFTMLSLPPDYHKSGEKRYPTIIYFHGKGATGVDGKALFREGLPRRIKAGWKPQAINPLTHKTEYFIVIAAQDQWTTPWPETMYKVMAYLQHNKKLRIDTNRVYTTGPSFGGAGSVLYAAWDSLSHKKVAAILSASPAADINRVVHNFKYLAKDGIPVWFYSGDKDGFFTDNAKRYSKELNRLSDSLKKKHISWVQTFHGGHCCWQPLYDGKIKIMWNGQRVDMYQWFLFFSKQHARR